MGCVPAKHLWPDWCCMQRPMRRQSRRMVSQLTRVTNFSELEVKQWYRLFLKDCPEGVLGEERFVTFFCNFYKRGDLEKKKALATQIFRTFDRDGSGSVDFREFLCGMSALLRGTTAQRLRWAFNMYDLDRNGSLSREELLNVLKLMYELQLTRRFDPDDPDEIRRAESHLEMMTEQIFQALDEDRDGQLQMREFVEGFRRNPSLLRLNSVEMTT
ncbi:neurocalcin homolog [Branchiostoma floridae x Branchiostoma belcheri]